MEKTVKACLAAAVGNDALFSCVERGIFKKYESKFTDAETTTELRVKMKQTMQEIDSEAFVKSVQEYSVFFTKSLGVDIWEEDMIPMFRVYLGNIQSAMMALAKKIDEETLDKNHLDWAVASMKCRAAQKIVGV